LAAMDHGRVMIEPQSAGEKIATYFHNKNHTF